MVRQSDHRERHTILLSDDSFADAEITLQALGFEQKRVVRLTDLVFPDFETLKIDEGEIVRRIRGDERLYEFPFAVFFSSDEAGDVNRWSKRGVSDLFMKPVIYGEDTPCVREIARQWLANGLVRLPASKAATDIRETARVGTC